MHTHTHAHTVTHTRTHTPVAYQGNETEEKVSKKRKVFKEDLKELAEVEWRTETVKKRKHHSFFLFPAKVYTEKVSCNNLVLKEQTHTTVCLVTSSDR